MGAVVAIGYWPAAREMWRLVADDAHAVREEVQVVVLARAPHQGFCGNINRAARHSRPDRAECRPTSMLPALPGQFRPCRLRLFLNEVDQVNRLGRQDWLHITVDSGRTKAPVACVAAVTHDWSVNYAYMLAALMIGHHCPVRD
jgi:hypothetical protein